MVNLIFINITFQSNSHKTVMLYKIGRIVTFEICNMLQLTVAIGSEEVTENQQKSVIVVQLETTAMPISPRMTRKYRLPMLPWPLLQRGETLSKFSTSSALKVLKDFYKFPNSCNHFIVHLFFYFAIF